MDGQLEEGLRAAIADHLAACTACREEYESVRALAESLAPHGEPVAPAGLWEAIRYRLDGERRDGVRTRQGRTATLLYRRGWRLLASAAAILLVAGGGWLLTRVPWESRATAEPIDFRPLLEQAGGDIATGIRALLERHGGEEIAVAQAAARMKVRVRLPERLPAELALRGVYLLKLGGDHRALAFHMAGVRGQLLLLQCPAKMAKHYGGHECLPCRVGTREGQMIQAGVLRLIHMESENVCICVVSTLEEAGLRSVLEAIAIEF